MINEARFRCRLGVIRYFRTSQMRDDLSPKAAEIKVFLGSRYFLLSGCSEPCRWDAELFVANASFDINAFKKKAAGYYLSEGLTMKLLTS